MAYSKNVNADNTRLSSLPFRTNKSEAKVIYKSVDF